MMVIDRFGIISKLVEAGSRDLKIEQFDRTSDILGELTAGLEPYTHSVEVVIQLSVLAAENSAAAQLTMAHFLIGVLCVRNSVATNILESRGISVKGLRNELLSMAGYRVATTGSGSDAHIKSSSDIATLFKFTHDWRLRTGEPHINTGHLLLSIVQLCMSREIPTSWMALHPIQFLTAADLKEIGKED